jgi:RNA polymerase sigma-70 factor (ECF subfamily)
MAEEMALRQVDPVPNAQGEASLVAAARDGEQKAFGELVTRHQDRIYGLALRLTGDAEEASDLAQEAFLKAWRGMRSFRGGSSFYTWVFRITVNEARSRMRYHAVRPVAQSLDEVAVGRPSRGEGPPEHAARMERKEIVERALARLAPEQRMMVILRDLEGRDYAEIADLLACPRGTVKSRLHRGRMALKELLAPLLGSGEDG